MEEQYAMQKIYPDANADNKLLCNLSYATEAYWYHAMHMFYWSYNSV